MNSTMEWLQQLCPEAAEWQVELIAEHIEQIRTNERAKAADLLEVVVLCADAFHLAQEGKPIPFDYLKRRCNQTIVKQVTT